MLDKEKRFEKVIAFYQALPNDLIEEIIKKLPGNRNLRRKLSRLKSINDKIEMLLSPNLRKIFVDTAYNTIKDYIPLELERAEYGDIIASITDDNKSYVAIFFFRWCYENGNDSLSNDDKYFDAFIDSKLFDCILNDKSIEDHLANIEKETGKFDKTLDVSFEQYDETSAANLHEEVSTMKLLGRIEKRNTFYNFFHNSN